jgi:Bacterial archaeo-eukaryotic release factor family 3
MFSRSDLDELVASEAQPAASLYLPTHVAGREIRQDPIRLKNLLASAEARLAGLHRKPEIDALLAPAEVLVGDEDFWRHQTLGLALFLAPGFYRVHKLPISIPEEIVLGGHFYIKPLLPLLEDAGPFWLLSISAKHTRAYRGSRWSFTEDAAVDLPQGVGKIRGMTDYEETQSASPVGRRGTLAHAQSFGEAPDELRKNELLEFLHRVASAFEPHLKGNPAPVILAAHPEIQGNFREVAGWKEIIPEGLSENPDAFARDELHRRAYALVEPKVAEARAAALDRLNALLATGRATTKPEEIVKAARYARVDTLFLTGDDHLWGAFDEAEERIVAHGSPAEGDIDLLDYAALMALRQGGSVTLVERTALPPPGLSAAILRY